MPTMRPTPAAAKARYEEKREMAIVLQTGLRSRGLAHPLVHSGRQWAPAAPRKPCVAGGEHVSTAAAWEEKTEVGVKQAAGGGANRRRRPVGDYAWRKEGALQTPEESKPRGVGRHRRRGEC